MGRLDDAAKRKVVELRKAGLSFRKIKAVLELENIKVSAQAIYLFLREFQGRPPGRVRPEETGGGISIATPQGPGHGGAPWSNAQLQSLLREASHHAGLVAASEFAKKTTAESNATRPGSGDTDVGTRPEQSSEGNKEETGIQIISVTSLAQNGQQRCPPQASVTRAVAGEGPSSITPAMRRRVTPSPATNPILAARKRILDKALSHRAKSFQQLGSLLRREHPGVPIPDLRNVAPGDRAAYDLTAEKTIMVGQPGGTNAAKRLPPQKPGLCARAPHPPPRFGVRPPNRTPAPLVSSASRVAAFPAATTRMVVAGNLGSQQPFQESEARSSLSGVNANGLQDQVQALGSEVRGLALAVKMLVEQQCRLEREQVQQTQVQRQILGALQGLASRLSPCRSLQPQKQRNKTPSPGSTSFSQDTFTYGQGASYTQCSQSQSRYTSIDGLEAIETFKLPEISTNGFEPCNNTDTLSTAQTQTYAAAYTQQQSASLHPSIPSYSQAYASTYGQSNTQTFKRSNNNKASDFSAACSEGSLQDFGISTQLAMNPNQSPKGNQLNIIKVEEP